MKTKQNIQVSSNNFLKTLSTIHLALLAGMIIFTIIAYFLSRSTKLVLYDENDIFLFIVPFAGVIGYLLSEFLYKRSLKKLNSNEMLGNKLAGYQTASIVRYALIEGPTLIALIAYLLNGNFLYLLIAIALILHFYSLRPKVDKIQSELRLNSNELTELNK